MVMDKMAPGHLTGGADVFSSRFLSLWVGDLELLGMENGKILMGER